MNDAKHSISKAASAMSLATTLSRLLGLARDQVSAYFFGASVVSDAFILAFRIPNLLRDLLAEGSLSAAFVPAMAKARANAGTEGAWRLASLMLNSMALLMALLSALGLLFTPQLVAALAPGFQARPEQFELTVSLARILFPFLSLMAFSSLLMGILISRQHFVTGAVAPIFLNMTMLGVGAWLYSQGGTDETAKVRAWAWGYLLAGLVQLLVHLPPVFKEGFRYKLAWPFGDAGVRAVWKQTFPAILGQSGNQVNLWINSSMASAMAVGSASYLYYGTRMMQLPLGIFAVAVSTAVLPTLAGQHQGKDGASFKSTLGYGLRLTLFFTLPASLGLILLSEPINILLFFGGKFGLEACLNAAAACSLYSLGIVFASLNKVLGPAFYARDEASVPVKVSLVGVIINIAVSLALRDSMGFKALALATSLSGLAQAGMLLWLIRRRLGPLLRSELLKDFGRICLAAALMGLGVKGLQAGLDSGLSPEALHARARLAWELPLLVAAGTALYLGLSKGLGLPYLAPLLGKRAKKP
jgi:putative peptidoglycan lipid II flippase